MGFPGSSAGKESTCNAGDPGLIPGLETVPGEGIDYPLQYSWASLVAQMEIIHLQYERPAFDPWVRKIPWRRAWQPIPVNPHGQRSLAGCSPTRGHKELATTERLHFTSLAHCRWILYCLNHQGSPRILEWVAYSFSRGSFQPRNQTRVSCTAGGFFII